MELCVRCGLCCNGAIFAFVPLEEADIGRLTARRLPIAVSEDGQRQLRLPCPAHAGACSIYEDRPANCAAYECKLLRAVQAGTTDEARAMQTISRVKELVASLRPRVPGNTSIWADIRSFIQDTPAWRREHATLLIDLGELRLLMESMEPRYGWSQP